MSEHSESPPPGTPSDTPNESKNVMIVKVKDQQEGESFFKIKPSTLLHKVFKAYCSSNSVKPGTVRFLYDGIRIQDDATPASLEMEDGDMIQAMLEQYGGDCTPFDAPDQELEPASSISGHYIGVIVESSFSGSTDCFKVNPVDRLGRLFDAVCLANDVDREEVDFFYGGSRISALDTPTAHDMAEGDLIEARRKSSKLNPSAPAEFDIERARQESREAPMATTPPDTAESDSPCEEKSDSGKSVTFSVIDQEGQDIYFKIKRRSTLRKLMDAYCQRQGLERSAIRFFFDGVRVQDSDTADTLDITDNDVLVVYPCQFGGAGEEGSDQNNQTGQNDDKGGQGDNQGEGGNPRPEGAATHINVKVKDQSNNEVIFKIKKTTPLSKVMNAYCQRQGSERGVNRFVFEGTRIVDHDTPESLDMEDEDCIDVFVEQTGGNIDETADENSPKTISINVKSQNGQVVTFKMKRDKPLKKLMDAYYESQGRTPDSLRFFLPDGKRINATDTPALLQMEDDEEVDVHEMQHGGHLKT